MVVEGGGERAVAGMPSRQREELPQRESADTVHASGEGRGRVDEGDQPEKGQDHEKAGGSRRVRTWALQAVPCPSLAPGARVGAESRLRRGRLRRSTCDAAALCS